MITRALQGVSGDVKYTLGRIIDSSNVDIILIDGSGSGDDASKSVCKIREALLKSEYWTLAEFCYWGGIVATFTVIPLPPDRKEKIVVLNL